MNTYYPNPYDFVPFSDQDIILKTVDVWKNIDTALVSGQMRVQIEALTPVHSVGAQSTNGNGKQITKSFFNQEGALKVIPAKSIKGTLRSFTEAACNCRLGELTSYYLRKSKTDQRGRLKRKRHHAFAAVSESEIELRESEKDGDFEIENAIPEKFRNKIDENDTIDLATYLFGFASEDESQGGNSSRIAIPDAIVSTANLTDFNLLDIPENAYMGSPNPNLRKWWYFEPQWFVWRKPGNFKVFDFIGDRFRGRKFYYHQDWQKCYDTYLEENNTLYPYAVECIKPGAKTEPFEIEFKELPLKLLYLFLWILQPAKKIRHKMGYGKPLGFGSVEFHVSNLEFNIPNYPGAWKPEAGFEQQILAEAPWTKDTLHAKIGKEYFCDASLDKLAQILTFEKDSSGSLDPTKNIIFKYPSAARNKGFWRQIDGTSVENALSNLGYSFPAENTRLDVSKDAWELAVKLYHKNPTIHFDVFQENARGYAEISRRNYANSL